MFFYQYSALLVGCTLAVATPMQRATSFANSCKNISLVNNWLIADCATESGTYIQSSVHLPSKLKNNEGALKWANGGIFTSSCTACSLAGTTLKCLCPSTWNGQQAASINLDEHIKNYEGHLLTDLDGPPTVPETSSIKIPANMTWELYESDLTCYSPVAGKCAGITPPIGSTDCKKIKATYSPDGTPACFAFTIPIAGPVYYQFATVAGDSPSNAWEFLVYDNVDCSGANFAKIESDVYGICQALPKNGKSVKINPLWNADW